VHAGEPPPSLSDLRNLSIEDLANLEVTSVAKRPESLSEAPASVYVITAADIRRSGAISLPEVLRLAPNLEVARLNAYSWTVTARGFNSPETANKLLVLVDGRSVYEPIASTILWQQVDVSLDNIERIEVISGPGGTLWGANAVNGVINIITKNAADTQGFYARAASGVYKHDITARFGGKIGERTSYRVYGDGFTTDEMQSALAGDHPSDAFTGTHGGLALDGTLEHGAWSLRAEGYRNTILDGHSLYKGASVSGTWNHTLSGGSTISLAAYADHDVRDQPNLAESPAYENRDTYSLSAQQSFPARGRHVIVWGGEIRAWRERFISLNEIGFAEPSTTISVGSLFVQDEIALKPALKLTLGLKGENSSYSGFEWMPNLRLAWRYGNGNLLWAAASRAVRTPNRIERELEAPPLLITAPDFASETLTALEAGWRTRPTTRSSLSLSLFYNMYDDLRTDQYQLPTIFPLQLQNGGKGTTYGLEGWGNYEVTPNWRLSAGLSLLHKHFELKPGHNDASALGVEGMDPDYQVQVRSEWNVTPTVDLDIDLRSVGPVSRSPVTAYTEANVRVGWMLRPDIELSVVGANLLHPRHLEFWDPSTTTPRYIGRSILISLRYGF